MLRFNWKKLYSTINDHRGGDSWRTLASFHKVTPSLFTRISQGKPTSVHNLLKLLAIIPHSNLQDFVDKKGNK